MISPARQRAVIGLLVACYPPSFRERYGGELAGLVEQVGAGPRVVWDLLTGAGWAWLRPVLPAEPAQLARRRLQATLATVWMAWCLGGLAVPGVDRALLDPPVAGITAAMRRLLGLAQIGWFTAAAAAAVGAVLVGWAVTAAALRARQWRLLAPMLPAAALAVLEAAGLGLLALLHRGHPGTWTHPSLTFALLGAFWLLGFAVLVVTAAIAGVIVLQRARPPISVMRIPAALAVVVALALAAATACDLVAVILAGGYPAAAAAVAAGAAMTATAMVSCARLLTIRSTTA